MSLEGGASTTLQNAVANAWNNGNGAVIVAAAGNEGDDSVRYPAGYPEVVSVAATDDRDARADFSNANSDVEIAAPGVDVLSTVLGRRLRGLSGTSMATPHVAGWPACCGSCTRPRPRRRSASAWTPPSTTSGRRGETRASASAA